MILMYHGILDDTERDPVLTYGQVHRTAFEKQMRWMAQTSKVVPLSEYHSPKDISITFDDGYSNQVKNALPILQKYRIPATFFVPTIYFGAFPILWFNLLKADFILANRVGRNRLQKFREEASAVRKSLSPERIYEKFSSKLIRFLSEPGLKAALAGVDEQDLRTIASDPLMEIGSHSHSHLDLSQLPYAKQRSEIEASKLKLESIIGRKIQTLSYPHGAYNGDTISCLKEAGIRAAYSVETKKPSGDLQFKIRRTGIYRDSLFFFFAKKVLVKNVSLFFSHV